MNTSIQSRQASNSVNSFVSNNTQAENKGLTKPDIDRVLQSAIPLDYVPRIGYKSISPQDSKSLGFSVFRSGMLHLSFAPSGKPHKDSQGRDFGRLRLHEPFEDGNKYIGREGEGNRPHFSPTISPEKWKSILSNPNQAIAMTEGERCGDASSLHIMPTIALGGVWAWKDQRDETKFLGWLPELESVEWKHRKVYLCFDSDLFCNSLVKAAFSSLALLLHSKGAIPYLVRVPCEIDKSKNGIDDFIYRHGKRPANWLFDIAEPIQFCKDKNNKEEYVHPKTFNEPIPMKKGMTIAGMLSRKLTYNPSRGWMEWVGDRWTMCGNGDTQQSAFDVYLHQCLEVLGWYEGTQGTLKTIESKVKAKLTVRSEKWNQPRYTGFQNGVLLNEKLIENRPEFYVSILRNFDYDPNATCPNFLNFLSQALNETGNKKPVTELIRASIRWTSQPKAIDKPFPLDYAYYVYGPRGSGKGVFLEILQEFVGKDSVGSASPDVFADREARSGLIGKLAAIDFDCAGHDSDSAALNKIMSNEPVPVRTLYVGSATERLGVVVWRGMNNFPSGGSGGRSGQNRRIIVIYFSNPPKKENIDVNLKEKLCKELSGIYNWVMGISESEMSETIKKADEIESVAKGNLERITESYPVVQFVVERFPDGGEYDSGFLFTQFKEWSDENRIQTRLSKVAFGRQLSETVGKKKNKGNSSPWILPKAKDITFEMIRNANAWITEEDSKEVITNKALPDSEPCPSEPPKRVVEPPSHQWEEGMNLERCVNGQWQNGWKITSVNPKVGILWIKPQNREHSENVNWNDSSIRPCNTKVKNKFSVGDQVKVKTKSKLCEFQIGTQGIVADCDGEGMIKVKVSNIQTQWLDEKFFVLATEIEQHQLSTS